MTASRDSDSDVNAREFVEANDEEGFVDLVRY
jgi:hypothetical protein